MNKEMKLLARKLTALFLTLALFVGLMPGKVWAEDAQFSFEIFDCEEVYYNDFNDNVAVAEGTCIGVYYGSDINYINVEESIPKEEGAYYSYEVTINGNESVEAQIVYESGDVVLKVISGDGQELYYAKLYTPSYVDISEMPTITLNQEVIVTDGVDRYCEQYYRVDVSAQTAESYKAFTIALNNGDEEYDDYVGFDTYLSLYNERGELLDENDDADEENYDIESAVSFKMPETGERIVGVKGYDGANLTYATLKLVAGANSIVTFESDNIDQLNTFYEGFNDNLMYATGTRIQATLDNGVVNEWQSYGYKYDYEDQNDEYDEENYNEITIRFGDVKARLYRGDDDSVYADYSLYYDASTLQTKKLYTPVIKPVSEMPEITEGEAVINTLPWEGSYSYYRITAEKDEVWNLHFSYTDESEDPWPLGVDVYEKDGTFLFNAEQEFENEEDESGVLKDLDVEISVPAGTTRIIGICDDTDVSQEYTVTATKKDAEPVTTEPETTEPTTTQPVTTPAATTKAPVVTKSAAQKKIESFKKTGKAKVKTATKKKTSKKIKITLKKRLKVSDGYQVRFFKTKKNAKKNKKAIITKTVKKNKKSFTVKNKKIAKKKTLYIRVRGYIVAGGKRYTGKWSAAKKVKIKK